MLTNIKLKNFRAFREDIDVRIRPITILIGRNSAGKSTLIKFLLMLQQTLESSESSEGDFFSTEGRHVSLGNFKDLKNSNFRSKSFQFTLNIITNYLPDPKIQQIREQLQKSKAIRKIKDNSIDIAINLNPFSTVTTEDPLGQATRVKVDSQITANDLMADFCVFGSIPYSGKQAKHIVTCKIGGKKVLQKEETNIRRTRFLKFPLSNDPVEILKSAFDNLYLDSIRNEIISMQHLSPVREESERSVILGSPPLDDVGHRGEYAMPHLQRLLTDGGERADFVLLHIESVVDIEDVKFKSQVKGFIPEFRLDEIRRRIIITLNLSKLVQHIWNAIYLENTEAIEPVFDQNNPIRSTGDMRSWYTGKPCEYTRKSHITCCTFDSTWEASEAFELDRNPNVEAWVKNDHLGFEILYIFEGVVRKYRPDFIIRLKTGRFLILETKGRYSQKDAAKSVFLDQWIQAVNQHGGFGFWQRYISRNPADVKMILDRAVSLSK
ncbi:AAA family ATPase [Nostoc sp.]|uniref:AAA family ATPase n=1 Tax=Nostoc sp. TaxID=1180 RepID=UPI002FF5F281